MSSSHDHAAAKQDANPVNVALAVLAGTIALILSLIMLAQYAIGTLFGKADSGSVAFTEGAVKERIQPFGQLVVDQAAPGLTAASGVAAAAGAAPAAAAAPAAPAAAAPAAAPADAAASAAPAPSAPAAPIGRINFAKNSQDIPDGAKSTFDNAVAFLKDHADAKIALTGYTDASGNADHNRELAKDRAKAVRAALQAAGVAPERIVMKPPVSITGSGSEEDARRVELNPELAAAPAAAAPAAAAKPEAMAKAEPAAAKADGAAAGKGKATYEGLCQTCHGAGLMNAPKFGDKAAWGPRIATGIDSLYNSALKGKNMMPAKGGNAALSDDDVKAAVDYMVSQAK